MVGKRLFLIVERLEGIYVICYSLSIGSHPPKLGSFEEKVFKLVKTEKKRRATLTVAFTYGTEYGGSRSMSSRDSLRGRFIKISTEFDSRVLYVGHLMRLSDAHQVTQIHKSIIQRVIGKK